MSTYTPISSFTATTSVSSVTIAGIPQNYTDLVLVVSATWSGGSNSSFGFRLNSDTGSNYSITQLYGDGSSASSGRSSNQTKAVIGQINPTEFGTTIFQFQNYSNATTHKTILSRSNVTGVITLAGVALWRNTAAITQIDLEYFDVAGTFDTGSTFNLYGIDAQASAQAKATGGSSIYTDGSYWYHTFLSSGTFTPTENLSNADYLVVAGGGGGYVQGGGAGGLRSTVTATGGGGTLETAQSFNFNTAFTITVGAGGVPGPGGTTGSDSSISGTGLTTITSVGGGGSGGSNGVNGGSGGGAFNSGTAGTGTANQGFAGGAAPTSSAGGGGGGAGAVGTAGGGSTGGNGGNGVASSITGSSVTYAGGGAGYGTGASGTAGTGGGVAGAASPTSDGPTNRGGGGGGNNAGNGGKGGSGIVVIRYAV